MVSVFAFWAAVSWAPAARVKPPLPGQTQTRQGIQIMIAYAEGQHYTKL